MEWKRVEAGHCNYMMSARKALWDPSYPEEVRIRCRLSARWESEGTPREPALRCELHHQSDVRNVEMIIEMIEQIRKHGFVVPYIELQVAKEP